MSCLCDESIEKYCIDLGMIQPFEVDNLQPASYELTFDGSKIYRMSEDSKYVYDYKSRMYYYDDPWTDITTLSKSFKIHPHTLYIASCREWLTIPPFLMARFEGKSTLGRQGLLVHITAGYIDPGFTGNLTLELYNLTNHDIILSDGDKIGQLSFHTMDNTPTRLYGECGNHYQYQEGPTIGR